MLLTVYQNKQQITIETLEEMEIPQLLLNYWFFNHAVKEHRLSCASCSQNEPWCFEVLKKTVSRIRRI